MTATLPKITEREFQQQVVELAKIRGWRVYHPFLSKWSERGFPDLTMVRPRDHRLLFAELKRDGGKTTPAQDEWIEALGSLHLEPVDRDGAQQLQDDFAAVFYIPAVEVYVWHPEDWDRIVTVLQ